MSWALNQGPSFNIVRPGSSYPKLNGFFQRFELKQDDPRFTPGKGEPHLPRETIKGTTKLKKHNRKTKGNPPCKDSIPKGNPEPIYGGFGKSMPNYASTRVSRKKPKLKKRRLK